MFGFALVGYTYTHKKINKHFFSFLSFYYFFSFSFDSLNQYCHILCLIHQYEYINVSVMLMYISIDMYIIITDTLIHSYYCILVAKLLYIFLTTPDDVEKYVRSNSSDNCIHHYNVEILNYFDPELQLINTKPVIKNKFKKLLSELKKFKI